MTDPELERHKQRIAGYRNFLSTTGEGETQGTASGLPQAANAKGGSPMAESTAMSKKDQRASVRQVQQAVSTQAVEVRSKSLVETPTHDRGPAKLRSPLYHEDATIRVQERSRRWAQIRDDNLAKQRRELEEQRGRECSFRPQSHGAEYLAAPVPASPVKAIETPGVTEHMARAEAARRRTKEAQSRVNVDTSGWTNRVTKGAEPQLGRKRPSNKNPTPMFSKEYDVIRQQLYTVSDAYDSCDREFEPSPQHTAALSDVARENEYLRQSVREKDQLIRYLEDRIKTLELKNSLTKKS